MNYRKSKNSAKSSTTANPEHLAHYLNRDNNQWDARKLEASKLANLLRYDSEFEKRVERLDRTAENLVFHWVNDPETGETKLKLKSAWFSRLRFDPVSSWRKSAKWQALFHNALPKIKETYPNHRWLFLTLTLKNCEIKNLNESCKHLNSSLKKMMRGAKLGKWFNPDRKFAKDENGNLVAGYFKNLEVTKEKNRKGYAHQHLHVLIHIPESYFDEGNYLHHDEWQQLWKNAAGVDYDPIIDIRTVKPNADTLDELGLDAGLDNAILEVTKYVTKSDDLLIDAEWTKEYIRQMNRVRVVEV